MAKIGVLRRGEIAPLRLAGTMVLDLGIPRVPGHGATHDAGRELLGESRTQLKIPVIILTTPHNFLQDHLEAYRLGVGVAEYLLKGAESDRTLLDAILRTVTAPTAHPLRFQRWQPYGPHRRR
jgi:CheY-like chemotaxis protein